MLIEIAFTVIAVTIIYKNEYKWLVHQKSWTRSTGTVLSLSSEKDSEGDYLNYPIVEWHNEKRASTFKSGISSLSNRVGYKVIILVSPDGKEGEIYSLFNRWLFTIFPLLLWSSTFLAEDLWW